ncbi:MAG: ATP-binding protein [Deltaproteobacteria bacterium]|nr:ATP-binding protein [Deltaproteobacteria bacterium]
MEAVALKTCPTCQGSGARITASGEFAHATLCTCQQACTRCEGTGRVFEERDGYRFLSPCTCQRARTGVSLFNGAHLPARCADQSFASLQPGFPELHSLRMISEGICHTFVPGTTKEGLLVAGPVGTGKTHLLASILRYLTLETRVSCRYVEISFLYSEIRKGFGEGRSSLDIIAPLADVPVLAIDELGKGKMSPFEQETLDELVSRRYNAGRPTFFATNYRLSEKAERPQWKGTGERLEESRIDQPLRERVGERVWSRLQQMCRLFELPANASDYRKSFAK